MSLQISIGTVALLSHLLLPVAGTCLPNAIPADQRKNLTDGESSYPIGVLVPGWTSGRVCGALLEILIQEALGYNVVLHPDEIPSTSNAIYGLLGCQDFNNINDRGCGQRKIRYHIFVESWISLYAHLLNDLAANYKGEEPRDGGSMGFRGLQGLYVPGSAINTAQASSGLALEYYKSWNASWHQPWLFFDNIFALNATEMLRPCSQSIFVENATIYLYYTMTGDADGVVINGSSYTARCDDGFWWLAPACRTNPHECVPYVTGSDGWALQASMQKATAWHMPLAEAVALSEETWTSIPKKITGLFYWWEPDETFLDLNPTLLVFPKFSRQARLRADYTTSGEEIDVVKLVSHNFAALAPFVADFLQNSQLEMENVRELISTVTPNSSREEVACNWLRSHEDLWASWIPDRTVCISGFGLYHDVLERFVSNRSEAQYLSCQPCPIGTFSEQFDDSLGVTFRCADCTAGREPATAASFCLPCPPGTYKPMPSRDKCLPCPFGTFQNETGAYECQSCANGTSTMGPGSNTSLACGCLRGTIEVERSGLNVTCVPCGTGLECPSLATLEGLHLQKSGFNPAGDVPQILPGYMSPDAAALSILKCGQPTDCPGGSPARCAGGRVAEQVCATCPGGWRWAGRECVPCEVWLIVLWAVASMAIFLAMPFAGFRRAESSLSVLRDLQFTVQELIFLAIQSLQVFAIIRQITVEWPSARSDVLLNTMLLGISDLGISCIVDSQPAEYVLQASFLPIACAWSCLCIFLASHVCRTSMFSGSAFVRSINTVGLVNVVFFEMACNMALAPFTCYAHPNGKHSVRQYPSVFCDTADHAVMSIMGGILVVLVVGFLTACAWAVWRMPYWTLREDMRERVAAFRFVKEGYRLDSWWYGVPVLLTGPLLSLPAVVAPDDPATQVGLTTVILFTHLLLLLLCWPWKVPVMNVIETVSVSGALFSAISAGFFLPTGSETSFPSAFSLLTRTVVFAAFCLASVLIIIGLIAVKCYGRTRRFGWMDLMIKSDFQNLHDGLFSIMESLAEMSEDHLLAKMSRMQPFDQRLLKSCICMLSMEVVPHDAFRTSMQMRATARIRSSYRTSYSLDRLAETGLSDDEESDRKDDRSMEAADSQDPSEESAAGKSNMRVCHVSFSPSISSTEEEGSGSSPEVFSEEL